MCCVARQSYLLPDGVALNIVADDPNIGELPLLLCLDAVRQPSGSRRAPATTVDDMLTSVHVADIGAIGPVWRPPRKAKVPGLVRADGGMAARLTSKVTPKLDPGRVIMVARWQSESSLAAFLSTTGSQFANGWTARCEPIRATGKWEGVEETLPSERAPETDEPVIVVTQSKIKWGRALDLVKFNADASGTMLMSNSLKWGSTYVGTPWFGSVTVWQSATEMVNAVYETRSGFGNATAPLESEMEPATYEPIAYGEGGHRGAITAHQDSSFFDESVYVRLRPLKLDGNVKGSNPLSSSVFG